MPTHPEDGLTETERYRFDRQGYLVIEDVLDGSELDALNGLIDNQDLPEPTIERGNGRRFDDFLEWGQPFRDLLDHDRILPVLGELLGDGFRFDHYYGIYLREGAEPLVLHGGGEPYDPDQFYRYQNGEMFNGLTVVTWNLRDTGPESGGFCCIPGSHKSNYQTPEWISEAVEDASSPDELPPEVVVPEAPAGSVSIFTEALTHGTAPWVADHQRRSLLYKYSPGYQSWSENYPEPPAGVEFTSRQERLFEPPHVSGRSPVVEDD
jgi:ectoine hydroxylase-related dioxygenase (phytanoyl-CoA dioxygenase family)